MSRVMLNMSKSARVTDTTPCEANTRAGEKIAARDVRNCQPGLSRHWGDTCVS